MAGQVWDKESAKEPGFARCKIGCKMIIVDFFFSSFRTGSSREANGKMVPWIIYVPCLVAHK